MIISILRESENNMIIWGWRKMRKVLLDVDEMECSNCHNINRFKLIRYTSWFTIFFIPLIPFKSDYFIVCPICEYGYKIDKIEKERIMQDSSRLR